MSLRTVVESKSMVVVRKEDGSTVVTDTIPVKVLDEDLYNNSLKAIIQKDYFPDLPKLKAQAEWNEAVVKSDFGKMWEIKQNYSRRYAGLRDGGGDSKDVMVTPDFDSTPLVANKRMRQVDDDGMRVVDTHLSVDEFTSKYVSEDDASFTKLITKQTQNRIEKYFSNKKIPINMIENERLELLSYPKGINHLARGEEELGGPVKAIVKENVQMSNKRDKRINSTEAFKKPVSKAVPVDEAEDARLFREMKQSRQISGGFDFVTVPSPNPEFMKSPMITWGEIEDPFPLDENGTPLLVEFFGDSSGEVSKFEMPKVSKDQKVADELLRKAANKRLSLQENLTSTPVTRGTPILSSAPNTPILSPAVQKLAHSGIFGKKIKFVDSQLRSTYSPLIDSGQKQKMYKQNLENF